ncbi:MAG: hypothetical protein CMI01_10295 [Oceanospirillaceae bacterium]|jgi:hypothetical protein|nr:hypothetical protein [Oceanospirillaceae bacterium]
MRSLLAALLLLGYLSTANADATATLDRTRVTALDNLTLSVEVTARVDGQPDFSPLFDQFRLLGSKRTLISSHSSAGREVRTRWEVSLRPRTSGTLTIPPLSIAGEQTEPVDVQVSEASPSFNGQEGSGLFFSTQLDSREVYLNGQLLYTARVYHLEPLPVSARIEPPTLNGVPARTVGERREYEGEFRGTPYLVTEQQYALFPDQEGLAMIQGPSLHLPDRGDHAITELLGETLEVEVLPPAFRSSQGQWLPAERLSLEDNWSTPETLQPGDRIKRVIRLTVTGLPAEQLPELMTQEPDGLFIDRSNVELSESETQFGLVSTRTETLFIEPLATGEFTLAPIDVHWWDTRLDRGRHAALPSRSFQVSPPAFIDAEPPVAATTSPEAAEGRSAEFPWANLFLTLTSITCALGWLYTGAALRRQRVTNSAQEIEDEARRHRKLLQANERAERNTFQALAIACQQNNAAMARARLIEWAQNFWPERAPSSLTEVCDAARNQTLDFLILDLEQQLHDNAELWQGDLLYKTVDALRRRRLNASTPSGNVDETLLQAS